jgi:uncharacterized protein with von Willebrand factor type A (vWA) domain
MNKDEKFCKNLQDILVRAVDADVCVSQLVLANLNSAHESMKKALVAREQSYRQFLAEFNEYFGHLKEFERVDAIPVSDKSLFGLGLA